MIKFNEFLNEARSKFPEYKVGDLVRANGYQEFQQKGNDDLKTEWDSYSKCASLSNLGMIGRIANIDNEKKEYIVEFTEGLLQTRYRGRSSTGSYFAASGRSYKTYLRAKASQLTTDGLDIAEKALKEEKCKPGDSVIVKVTGEKSVTRKVIGIAINPTIEKRELTYQVEGISGGVKSSIIEKEIDLKDEVAIKLVAEEIAKILGTKIQEDKSHEFIYEVAKLDGKDMVTGTLYFIDDAAREKFTQDLQKFIDSKLDVKLQKIMNGGESSIVKVKEMSSGTYSWYKAGIAKSKILQAARNIGINVKEFLEKKRGAITGKRYGLG